MMGSMANDVLIGTDATDQHSGDLRKTGRNISSCIFEDDHLPDPWELIQFRGTASRDYGLDMDLIKLKRLIVIPDIVLAQYNERDIKDSRSFMGLFGDIGRAWMTIDNRLYVWEYREQGSIQAGKDLTCWSEGDHPIIDVVLVKPRSGVFIDLIQWLMVVVTPGEIHLVGVSFSEDGDLILHRTGLVFGTDQISMLSAVGTSEGRIFCSGQDGQVYELLYQSEEGWFTRKCRKIALTGSILVSFSPTFLRKSLLSSSFDGQAIFSLEYDPSRGLLWTLSESNRIECYWLGSDRKGWEKIGSVDEIAYHISRLCPSHSSTGSSSEGPLASQLVGIHAIPVEESRVIHLTGVTSNGARVYLSTLNLEHRSNPNASISPECVEIVHVRPAPPDDLFTLGKQGVAPGLFVGRRSMAPVHTTFYQNGLLLTAGSFGEEEDLLACRSISKSCIFTRSDANIYLEDSIELRIDGKVWDIVEISTSSLMAPKRPPSSCWDEVVRAHLAPIRQFLCLTNAGIYVFEKERPSDRLARLLIASNGVFENEALQDFFHHQFPTDQALSFALVLATKNSTPESGMVKFWATQAISRFAGEPTISVSRMGLGNVNINTLVMPSSFSSSPLHAGLYRFFGRIIRDIWKVPINLIDTESEAIRAISLYLESFRDLLERNSALFLRSRPSNQISSDDKSAAFKIEHDSIIELSRIIRVSQEIIAFLSICHDYGVSLKETLTTINANVGLVDFELVASSTLRGMAVIHEMAQSLVQRQLSLQASVESLCSVLKDRCPTFFSSTDISIFEGTEALERALRIPQSSPIRMELLEAALSSFISAGKIPTGSNLINDLFERFRSAHFYSGILKLGLSAVKHMAEEVERDTVYSAILESFRDLIGSRPADTIEDLDHIRETVFQAAFQTKNLEFLHRFYAWLFEAGLAASTLLGSVYGGERADPKVEDFLAKYAFTLARGEDQINKAVATIYWKYLVKYEKYLASGQVLLKIASQPTRQLNLQERIECLSIAINNLKSDSTGAGAEVLEEVEDRLEVGLIQLDLLQQAKARGNVPEQVILELDSSLYSVTDLFLRYSKPLGFPEISLAIIHVSGHSDPVLVSQLWQEALFQKAAQIQRKDMELIGRRFQTLAQKLYPSEAAFPLNYLIDMLALLAYQQIDSDVSTEQLCTDWFVSLWARTPVPLSSVFVQIDRLLVPSTSTQFWTGDQRKRSFLKRLLASIALFMLRNDGTTNLKGSILDRLSTHATEDGPTKDFIRSIIEQIRVQ